MQVNYFSRVLTHTDMCSVASSRQEQAGMWSDVVTLSAHIAL